MATVTRRRRRLGTDPAGQPIYGPDEGWQVRYVDPDGGEHRKKFPKKADADRFATEVEHRKLSGLYVDPAVGRVSFRAYAEEWRASRPHRDSTRDQVESQLRLHVYPAIGDRPIAAIRKTELQALVTERADHLGPAALENVVTWVQTIFRAAVEDRILTVSPAARLRAPAPPVAAPVQPFDLEAVEKAALALPAHLSATVALGVGAGLRSGEVLGLTRDRVDFLRRIVKVDRQLITPKGGPPHLGPPKTRASTRDIPVGGFVINALAAHLADHPVEPDGFLFTSSAGLPLRRTSFAVLWRSAADSAGLPPGARFHGLRHTYASLLIRTGCSVKVVQARLGHASAQETLDTYAHLWPDDDDRTRDAVDNAWRELHAEDVEEAAPAAP